MVWSCSQSREGDRKDGIPRPAFPREDTYQKVEAHSPHKEYHEYRDWTTLQQLSKTEYTECEQQSVEDCVENYFKWWRVPDRREGGTTDPSHRTSIE
jgi:hypothetical protein